jgi:hypothetical protein
MTGLFKFVLWMYDASNQDGYEVTALTDGKTWIRVVVPVDPLRYNGRTAKSFFGKPEAKGWRFREIDGLDQIAFNLYFDTGRYDGIQERCPLETTIEDEQSWQQVCQQLHTNMTRAS